MVEVSGNPGELPEEAASAVERKVRRLGWMGWFFIQGKRFVYSFMARWHQTRVLKIFKKNPEKGRHHMKRAFYWGRKQHDCDYIKVADA